VKPATAEYDLNNEMTTDSLLRSYLQRKEKHVNHEQEKYAEISKFALDPPLPQKQYHLLPDQQQPPDRQQNLHHLNPEVRAGLLMFFIFFVDICLALPE
jgi:hypothetical protein